MDKLFLVGERVVHPLHGVGIIKEISKKEILGEVQDYYIIEFFNKRTGRIWVPVNKAKNLGLRKIGEKLSINEILAELKRKEDFSNEFSKNFQQRYKEYFEKLQTGEIKNVIFIYKALSYRKRQKPLGMKDKNLYETAKKLIIMELKYAGGFTEQQAIQLLEEVTDEAFKNFD